LPRSSPTRNPRSKLTCKPSLKADDLGRRLQIRIPFGSVRDGKGRINRVTSFGNLLAPPTRLPEDPAGARIDAGDDPIVVAARFPASSAAWATLAEGSLDANRPVEAYAYARTGYHRGLDALRRAGWKGSGPVPWSHEPNRGFLRAVHALSRAAAAISDDEEATRCATLLADCDPAAVAALT
jgi:Protein of unknown function (DUF3151)